MHRTRTVEQDYLECDGCGYLLTKEHPMVVVTVPFDYPLEFLQDDGKLIFHFHALTHRHDCFRYWAHNPRIMCESLKARKLSEEQIQEFMELMLYREDRYHPGIEKPKEKMSA